MGHSDIAPLRKIDPGEKCPWKFLASKGVGIWHDFKPEFLKKHRKIRVTINKDKIKFLKKLKKIGYCFSIKKNFHLIKTTKAFQRRFRKELINGVIDEECLLIATNLSKKV